MLSSQARRAGEEGTNDGETRVTEKTEEWTLKAETITVTHGKEGYEEKESKPRRNNSVVEKEHRAVFAGFGGKGGGGVVPIRERRKWPV